MAISCYSTVNGPLGANEGCWEGRGQDMIETQRILVVDDDFEARLLIARMVEAGGFTATAAADAQEALNALHAQRFDLVLLDVLLPDIDGFEACRRIREFSAVPVICKMPPLKVSVPVRLASLLMLSSPADSRVPPV